MSKAKRIREENFKKLNDKEQTGVLKLADEVAVRFPRIYAAYLKVLELLKLHSQNRLERYRKFLAENPHLQDDISFTKNLYVPYTENNYEIDLVPVEEPTQPSTESTVMPIDEVIKNLEKGLAELQQSKEI